MAYRFLFAVVAVVVAYTTNVDSAECHGKPNPNATANSNPIMTGPPVFVKSVKNGKLYTVGVGDDMVPLVHLYGTPYEMGYAHGQLLGPEVKKFVTNVMAYIEEQAEQAINGSIHNLKPWFVEAIAKLGVVGALNAELDLTEKFTGAYFDEELKGMSDSSGVDYQTARQVHMVGELTKGSCSMYGAWGDATKSTGSLMQLRALDWDVDGPFKDHPEITVYHPKAGNGHAFANVAWTGFIGSITGISSTNMSISEIGVSFPDDTFGKESRLGTPFTYLLRDILQFDETLAASKTHLKTAHRTCDLIFGVGDGKSNQFNSVQYSASDANFFDDTDMMPVADWHPRMKDVVYYGMDWLCPGYTTVLHAQLQKNYGDITAATTIHDIVPIVQTGDLHIAVYDLTNMIMHVANARKTGAGGPALAYDRGFIELDMNKIFAEEAPPSL
eukprot:m.118015 g.118015  ORF g.118015 m.118015 type:complete len:442 (+) comp28627_c0_seq1:48-1373(+)